MKPKMDRDDVLNAVITDVVADQVRRALELGFKPTEVEKAVAVGTDHGFYEYTKPQGLNP